MCLDVVRMISRAVACTIWLALVLGSSASAEPILDVVRQVERDLGARVGFYMHDLETGIVLAHAEDHPSP